MKLQPLLLTLCLAAGLFGNSLSAKAGTYIWNGLKITTGAGLVVAGGFCALGVYSHGLAAYFMKNKDWEALHKMGMSVPELATAGLGGKAIRKEYIKKCKEGRNRYLGFSLVTAIPGLWLIVDGIKKINEASKAS